MSKLEAAAGAAGTLTGVGITVLGFAAGADASTTVDTLSAAACIAAGFTASATAWNFTLDSLPVRQ